jgi:probable selenate reductase FAD-binding subunit
MIIEYHRPDKIDEALQLLSRLQPKTVPMGGGSVLNAPSEEQFAVVDLQNLGLDKISAKGSTLTIGAAATLQALLDTTGIPLALAKAIQHEASYNLRNSASIAGTLVAASGRSAFTTAMLALDAQLILLPGNETLPLGELLPMRGQQLKGRLIKEVSIPLNVSLAYEYVARTPADLPIVCVAVARWQSGRQRIVLGGWGKAPMMVVDGKDENDVLPAVESATLNAADEWASAEYRTDVARTLVTRCLAEIK